MVKIEKLKTILLMGNPNVGKSVVFSRLTGANVTTSNYPGTTIDIAKGIMRVEDSKITLMDAPGIYSLESTNKAEEIAVKMIDEGDLIIDVIDSTNLERNLYLTLELLEQGRSMVIALNMWDDAKHKCISINVEELERQLMQLEEQEKGQKEKLVKAYQLYTDSAGPEKEIYEEQRKKDEQTYQSIIENLERTRREYSVAKNKKDFFDEFQNALKGSDPYPFRDMRVKFKTQGQLVDFLFSLPPKEKKRMIESVMSPETGGRCILRYLTAWDIFDDEESIRGLDDQEIKEQRNHGVTIAV